MVGSRDGYSSPCPHAPPRLYHALTRDTLDRSTEFNFEGLKIWNGDVVTRTRSLDPATIQQQLAGYSQETLEDFWGNSQVTEEEARETVDGDLSWGDAGEEREEGGVMSGREVSDDADEGEG